MSILDLIEIWATKTPEAAAILAPDRAPLDFAGLDAHVRQAASALHEFGIGRNDRIAMVLPNSPETVVCFLAVAAAATCAPLNPDYRADEFNFYLSDLQARALIVPAGSPSPARAIAADRGIAIIELTPARDSAAGLFNLACRNVGIPRKSGPADADDIALVLHTSGTTSRPKLVPLTHRNLSASARNICQALQLTPEDRCLNIMPLFHIHGLMAASLASLAAGGSVVCTRGLSTSKFFDWLGDFKPTWYTAVPTLHQAILAKGSAHPETLEGHRLRLIRSSSAPLAAPVMEHLEELFDAPVIEAYGMTEAAHQMASNPLPPRMRKPRSVGPAAGPQIEIMDEKGNILGAGETGEVVIRGENVTAGYENNPEANDSAFTNGWFRTGDLGYLDYERYLYLSGRIKEIINRGGEKISPREVDDVLMEHPAVAQVVTFAMPDVKLGEDVAAAVVLRENARSSEEELREFAGMRLAHFKVPRQITFLEELPKGPSGKLQRIGLADKLGLARPEPVAAAPAGPRNPVEERLTELWCETLGLNSVGIYDKFLDVGGDSISGAELLTRVNEEFGADLSLIGLFGEACTIAAMADLVASVQGGESRGRRAPTPSASTAAEGPLTFAQEGWWFLNELATDGVGINRSFMIRLRGPLDESALRSSLMGIVQRHAILRTTFPRADGELRQVIADSTDFDLPRVDLAQLPQPECEKRMQREVRDLARARFDLARGPIWRAALYRLGGAEHVLFVCIHHIAVDGPSLAILFRELVSGYETARGRQETPPPLPIQVADVARWERQSISAGIWDDDVKYWSGRLQPPLSRAGLDHPRPAVPSFAGAREYFRLSPELSAALADLGRAQGVTLFTTLFAALAALQHRYTQAQDLIIGTSVEGRARAEFKNLIGAFANLLPLRIDAGGNPTFLELLERACRVTMEALMHRTLPFEHLVQVMQPSGMLTRLPLVGVHLVLNREMESCQTAGNLVFQFQDFDPRAADFDLTLEMWEGSGGLHGYFEYSTQVYEAAPVSRMVGHFERLLAGIVAQPNQKLAALPMLSPEERHQILTEWNNTRADFPCDRTLCQLFEGQVERTPDAPAVRSALGTLTFRELNARANRLARHLQKFGIAPETLIGLCVDRSPAMIVAMLGILKAGCAYVPLDPAYPHERLAFMVEDAQIRIIVTQEGLKAQLSKFGATLVSLDGEEDSLERESSDNLPRNADPGHLAYVLYTSGSTGQPKGVCIEHRNAVAFLTAAAKKFDADVRSGTLCATSINFDISILEIFLPLCFGGTILLVENIFQLASVAASNDVRIVQTSPSVMAKVLESGGLPGAVRTVVLGGEPLPEQLARTLLAAGKEVWNLYGPCETTTYSTGTRVLLDSGLPPSIGRPIENTRVYILGEHQEPVPAGIAGELYIGGEGVARGYLRRPELTADRFLPDPFAREPNARMYWTGDLARYRADGEIEFLGRLDHQIKRHGIRIEPGEVEAALKSHAGVRDAVVLAREISASESQLAAYLVLRPSTPSSNRQWREYLKQKLPEYMIPSAFVVLDNLPMTPNGKLDRLALRAIPPVDPEQSDSHTLPRDRTELELCQLWEQILNLPRVRPQDNFFDLGGNSLLTAEFCAALAARDGHKLSLRVLYEAPTVEGIAAILREGGQPTQWKAYVPIQSRGVRPPLFYIPPLNAVLSCYPFTETLGGDQPVYGLLATPSGDRNPFARVEDEAAYYVDQIREVQPRGPYYLAGWSYGGVTAFETAQQLSAAGEPVAFLGILDTGFRFDDLNEKLGHYRRRARYLAGLGAPGLSARARNRAQILTRRAEDKSIERSKLLDMDPLSLPGNDPLGDQIRMARYNPRPYPGRVVLFRTRDMDPHQARDPFKGWSRLARGGVEVFEVDGEHGTMMGEPYIRDLSVKFGAALIKAQRENGIHV